MNKTIHASGKRKKAIARATITTGKGLVRINSLKLENYSNNIARMKIQEPLILAQDVAKQLNIQVNVKGGGWQSQAEATRLAISKALAQFDSKLKKTFLDYDRHLLVADTRRTETNKPNVSKARKKRQKSYR